MTQAEIKEVEDWLNRLYIAAEGAGLRQEEFRKAAEVAAMLEEISRAAAKISRQSELLLVDAAAGKSYVGLLAAKLLFEPAGRNARIVCIERNASRLEAAQKAAGRLGSSLSIEYRAADVGDHSAWPENPSIVTALHACGPASDRILDEAVRCGARVLLLAPCCTSKDAAAAAAADEAARRYGIPPQAPVRRRFIQAFVDSERTWRLESAGYETEVVEFVGAIVTPHNLLWRARRVLEPRRMENAKKRLENLFRV
jgi:hypothetical protein